MKKCQDEKFVFPLTCLQIGDMQSYLSDLSLFLSLGSHKLYILVDNRPWLRDLVSRPAHLWQLMVTKYRLSPFANSKAQRRRGTGKKALSWSNLVKIKKPERWYKLIDTTALSHKTILLPVKKLRSPSFLRSELHRTLSGFIVFEVAWADVRGINYLNELQTDTYLAIESKVMRRWEFDSVGQAANSISSWFSGSSFDKLRLKEYLGSSIGEKFYDAEVNFSKPASIDDYEGTRDDYVWSGDNASCCSNSSTHSGDVQTEKSEPHTPPPTGSYKRRRVIKSIGSGVEVDYYSEEIQSESEDSSVDSESHTDDCENVLETKEYRDVLILFRFTDRDLPFKLRDVIMSNLRLLTLLEAGLPSWVIFLQSYPGFCNLYRPWMCPLARALYVIISIVTVLIGFYDLYKNVPVLRATASRLCGPLLDWIETWEMVSRIQYLGTMLFLQNFQKAFTWSLQIMRTTKSFFTVLTRPLVVPLMEILGFLLPVWNVLFEVMGSLCSFISAMIGYSCRMVGGLAEIVLFPLWFLLSLTWNVASSVLYPIFWIIWGVLYTPVRMVLALFSFLAIVCSWILELVVDIWQSLSGIFKLASATEATVRSTHEVSMWRTLWNDLFSQVFRALRSILYGFVDFFAACNRHRLSIYNYMRDSFQRIHGQGSQIGVKRSVHGSQRGVPEARRDSHIE